MDNLNDSKFNIFGYSETEIKESGFPIVEKIWLQDNPNATEIERDKFVEKFFRGYEHRTSKLISKPSTTIPDPLVSEFVVLKTKYKINIEEITQIHKASMLSEIKIGNLLEEYIHVNSLKYGWSVCWGATFKATDLVSLNGDRLQIKNKTNTENSSSNKIREGTNIKVWHRFDARTGATYWDELNKIIGSNSDLSESAFREFAKNALLNNSDMLNLN